MLNQSFYKIHSLHGCLFLSYYTQNQAIEIQMHLN
jgi:hypothetical protein